MFVALREIGAIILALRVTLEMCGSKSPRVILPTYGPFCDIVPLQFPLILELSLTIDTSKRERLRDTRRQNAVSRARRDSCMLHTSRNRRRSQATTGLL